MRATGSMVASGTSPVSTGLAGAVRSTTDTLGCSTIVAAFEESTGAFFPVAGAVSNNPQITPHAASAMPANATVRRLTGVESMRSEMTRNDVTDSDGTVIDSDTFFFGSALPSALTRRRGTKKVSV